MPRLIDKRVIFFSGKGGVGKSTLNWASGLCCAKHGKRALIIEIFPSNISRLFGISELEYKPKKILDNLFAMHLDPYEALEEYMTRMLKFKPVVKMFLKSKVFRSLSDVAPAWRELITLGKIWYAEVSPHRHPFDIFLVDMPATGHGISLFKVPKAAIKTLGFSPIRTHTLAVQHLLTDPSRTRICVVATPEELAVREALELFNVATDEIGIPRGRIFLNMAPPKFNEFKNQRSLSKEIANAIGINEPNRIYEIADFLANWRKRAQDYAKFIESQTKEPPYMLPYIPGEMTEGGLEKLAKAIEPALLGKDTNG